MLQLDNFRKLKGFGWKNFSKMNLWQQDKGQQLCPKYFLDAIKEGKSSPIPVDEIFEVSQVTLDINRQLKNQA